MSSTSASATSNPAANRWKQGPRWDSYFGMRKSQASIPAHSNLPQDYARPSCAGKLLMIHLLPSMEMNIIIIAACIPTLRPLFLILFNRPGAAQYLSGNKKSSSSGLPSRQRAYQIPSNASTGHDGEGGGGNTGRVKAFDDQNCESYCLEEGGEGGKV